MSFISGDFAPHSSLRVTPVLPLVQSLGLTERDLNAEIVTVLSVG